MKADWGKLLIVPQEILYTIEDQIFWSETQRIVYFVELTEPWHDAKEMAYGRKKLIYTVLTAECGCKQGLPSRR